MYISCSRASLLSAIVLGESQSPSLDLDTAAVRRTNALLLFVVIQCQQQSVDTRWQTSSNQPYSIFPALLPSLRPHLRLLTHDRSPCCCVIRPSVRPPIPSFLSGMLGLCFAVPQAEALRHPSHGPANGAGGVRVGVSAGLRGAVRSQREHPRVSAV